MRSPGILIAAQLEQDSKYASPTAPAIVPQEVVAKLLVRRQIAQSVQVSKTTQRSSNAKKITNNPSHSTVGKWSSANDNSVCTSCPENSATASTGSTSAGQCICNVGFYESESSCVSCGSGTTAAVGSLILEQVRHAYRFYRLRRCQQTNT